MEILSSRSAPYEHSKPLLVRAHITTTGSFRLDIRRLHNRPPLRNLGLLVGPERLGCALVGRRHVEAFVAQAFLERLVGQGCGHRLVELENDLFGGALWRP